MLKEKDSKESIQVTIRVRPLSEKELADDPRTCVRLEEGHSLQLTSAGETKKFTFDSICFNQSQQELFDRVGRKCTLDCLEGYNCTVFAYGQTGAGKTYTMMGLSFEHERYYQHRGLLPRTLEFLFACIDKQRAEGVSFLIKCSFLEIYNEQIVDLLNKGNFNLQLREDTRKGVYVEGITEQTVTRSEEAMDILAKGAKSRHVGSTFYNEASSRSHSVFTMQIESRYSKNGVINTKSRQFNFIDLAGSERTKQSTGERLKEGCNINKSLMNLAAVINALSEVSQGKAQHINYRNSKLTFLLKDSLGGNSRTNLIANISPAALFYQETLSTLGFARRAKLIKREKASINEDSSGNLDSMKNQIKRLKQEVITLMGRLQSGAGQEATTEAQPSQMTAIMHQYVSEEIDKQTRLEVQILKLTERVGHLQTGVKQYSTNEVHLRMIIAVLEDKLQRLKQTEKILAEQVDQLSLSDQQSKAVIEYFRNERINMLKEMDVLKKQAEGGRFLRELLKQAKIVREEGEDDSLKELLSRNTAFLTAIHSRLNDIRPDRVEVNLSSEFQRKAVEMANEFAKKEEQYGERVQQLNLELNDYRSRNEDSEKLLQQAVGVQISLQERARTAQDAADRLTSQLNQSQLQVNALKEEIQTTKAKGEEAVAQIKSQLSNSQSQTSLLRKELLSLQAKLEKSLKNQTILKEEFASLEQQKYKLEKQLMQQIEDMREQKNLLIKYQSEITLLQQRTDAAIADTMQIQLQLQQAHDQANEERKQNKSKLEEINLKMQKDLEEINNQKELLSIELEKQTKEVEKLLNNLLIATQLSEEKSQQWRQTEADLQQELKSKEEKMNELLSLINEKELNGNETAQQLSQIKLELINAHTEREATENKLRKQIEELKEKLSKERTSYEQLEIQAAERAKQLDKLTIEYQSKKKESQEQAELTARITTQLQTLKADYESVNDKLEQTNSQIESMRIKEKESKLAVMEAKNELFVAIKNAEIEVDALRSQLTLKDTQIEQLEKEQSKNKGKYEKQLAELERELSKNREMFEAHQENMRKSTQTHLMAKEKKIADIRLQLQQREQQLKNAKTTQDQLTTQLEATKLTINNLQIQLELHVNRVKELEIQIEEKTQNLAEMKEKMGKELEQAQIVHGEQIDQKNQQIEAFMLENEALQKKIALIKTEKSEIEKKRVELEESLTVSQKQQSDLYIRNTQLLSELETKDQQLKTITHNLGQVSQQMNQTKVQLVEQVTQLTKSYEQQQSLNQQLAASIQTVSEKLTQAQEKVSIINEQLTKKKEEVIMITLQLNQKVQDLDLKTEQNAQLQQQMSDAQHIIDDLTNQIKTYRTQIQLRERAIEQSSEIVAEITVEKQQLQEISKQHIQQLTSSISSLQSRIEELQQQEAANKLKLTHFSQLAEGLTESLSSERIAAKQMLTTNQSLNDKISHLTHQNDKLIEVRQMQINTQQQMQQQIDRLTADLHHLQKLLKDKTELLRGQELELSRMGKLMQMQKDIRERFEENGERMKKEADKAAAQIATLTDENKSMTGELLILGKNIKEIDIQRTALREKLANYQQMLQKTSVELSELSDYRRKWELQNSEMEQLRSRVEQQSLGRERISGEMVRERENNSSLRLILENSEAQVRQLQLELQQKDSIYHKLLEKIAKNEGESKRVTTSDHYLKTIELLEKTRAESLELRRQNEELRKGAGSLREALEEKEGLVREVERKAEAYSVNMHKQMESIQAEYMEYEKIKDRLVREKKASEKLTHENESLKEQIKLMKHNAAKLLQKHEETEGRLKKSHLQYIQLEKEYQELKKGQLLPNPTDDKTAYINRLKAEVAALKTEKVLLSDSLSKQREEKTKLKAQMRYGKEGGDGGVKLELEKKINQNKNLQELIFQIISQLKICVVEPKTKLEAIRSVILGTIKEKNNEIRTLKDKIKDFEQDLHLRQPTREFKTLSISNGRNLPEEARFDKEKDPAMLSTNSRQKMKEFQNYYARFRQAEDRSRP